MIEQRRFSRDLALGRGTPKLARTRHSQLGVAQLLPVCRSTGSYPETGFGEVRSAANLGILGEWSASQK